MGTARARSHKQSGCLQSCTTETSPRPISLRCWRARPLLVAAQFRLSTKQRKVRMWATDSSGNALRHKDRRGKAPKETGEAAAQLVTLARAGPVLPGDRASTLLDREADRDCHALHTDLAPGYPAVSPVTGKTSVHGILCTLVRAR